VRLEPAQTVVGEEIRWIQADGFAVFVACPVQFTLAFQGVADAGVKLGQVWILQQRRCQNLLRLVDPSQGNQRQRPAVDRWQVLRIE
jgi:hypothetical protein